MALTHPTTRDEYCSQHRDQTCSVHRCPLPHNLGISTTTIDFAELLSRRRFAAFDVSCRGLRWFAAATYVGWLANVWTLPNLSSTTPDGVLRRPRAARPTPPREHVRCGTRASPA